MGGGAARRRSGGRLAAPRESCWRELERAGRGRRKSRPGPEVGKGPSATFPTSAKITHTRPNFLTIVPQNGQVGVWEIVFVSRAGPRSISKRAIIDERGIKISEEVIYFCDSGSPFSEKMCQNCCKGCQILTSRNSLPAARGSSRQPPEVPGASAARDLPSTRAGGQDDVSSQTNSLKQAGVAT